MSTFTTPLLVVPTALVAGTILPAEAIPFIGVEPLDVRWLESLTSGRRNWMVLSEFDFASQVLERIVRIPAGFVTDFISTPWFMWAIAQPTGPGGKPSLVHDYLYRTAEFLCTREEADLTFQEAMQAMKVAYWKEKMLFDGVRTFGEGSFVSRLVAA